MPEHESVTESSLDVQMGQQRLLSYRFQEGSGHKRERLKIMRSRGRVVETAQSKVSPTHPLPLIMLVWGNSQWERKVRGTVLKEEDAIGQSCESRKTLREKNSMCNRADTNCIIWTRCGRDWVLPTGWLIRTKSKQPRRKGGALSSGCGSLGCGDSWGRGRKAEPFRESHNEDQGV